MVKVQIMQHFQDINYILKRNGCLYLPRCYIVIPRRGSAKSYRILVYDFISIVDKMDCLSSPPAAGSQNGIQTKSLGAIFAVFLIKL